MTMEEIIDEISPELMWGDYVDPITKQDLIEEVLEKLEEHHLINMD